MLYVVVAERRKKGERDGGTEGRREGRREGRVWLPLFEECVGIALEADMDGGMRQGQSSAAA